MLKIHVLGCGSSVGVPVIGCKCSVCKSVSNYNKRRRSSIVIKNQDTKILVDFGFDVRVQLLEADIGNLDGAILTHDHADHISGLDDLRIFFYIHGKPLDVYVNESIASEVSSRYYYLFSEGKVKLNVVKEFQELEIKSMKLQLFPQIHGSIRSLGIRADNFVYSCDVSEFLEEYEKYLSNLDVWIVDCMDYKSNNSHAGLDKVLGWSQKYKPQKIYLTNMNHNIDYHQIIKELPMNIYPCHDGMVLRFDDN